MGWRGGLAFLAWLAAPACHSRPARARVGIAVEPGWYAAVRLAQADLKDLPIDWIADSTRNVQVAASALDYAVWLADQEVSVVVGHSGSRGSVAASTVYGPRGIVQVAPVATSRKLRSAGNRAFGLVPDDSAEGAFIGEFADRTLHARRVALLYNQDEFGIGLRDGVVAELGRRHIEAVDERYLAPAGAPGPPVDISVLVAAILQTAPDVLVLGSRIGETREVAAYLHKRGLRIPVICSDGSYVLPPEARDRNLSDLEGLYIVRFWSPDADSSAARFARRFQGRYGYLPDQSEAFTYDALMLVGEAVRGGARTSEQFAGAFGAIGREALPHDVVAGPYQFDNGRPRAPRMEIGVVRAGVLSRIGGIPPT